MNYQQTIEGIDRLCQKYDFLSVTFFGTNELDIMIPMITLGTGDKSVFYIGGQNEEEQSTRLLFEFTQDYCSCYASFSNVYGTSVRYLYKNFSIILIPFLPYDIKGGYCLGEICNHIRFDDSVKAILKLSEEKEGIVCFDTHHNCKTIKCIEQMTGFKGCGERELDGVDKIIEDTAKILPITVGYGKRKSPFVSYTILREMLFCFPTLF